MKTLLSIYAFFLTIESVLAAPSIKENAGGNYPKGTILDSNIDLIGVLSLIQSLLLKVALPIVIVGGSLYVAYELFTADGDETKMKRAWKSVTFSVVGLICIAVSYVFVSLISRISL